MNERINWNTQNVEPSDLLSAANTITPSEVTTCSWVGETRIQPNVYLEWAKEVLIADNDFGWSTALHYGKLTVTRLIDGFILANHLRPFLRRTYPEKMAVLKEVGVDIPNIVHDLVIGPRNRAEHDYGVVNEREARHGVDLAELFLQAVREELEANSIVVINSAISGGVAFGKGGARAWFSGLAPTPMVFIDVFDLEPAAKIVNAGQKEILRAPLDRFKTREAVDLARYLRRPWSHGRSHTGHSSYYFETMKREGGF